jgi:hypothetical protein
MRLSNSKATRFKKGSIPFNKGQSATLETKQNQSEIQKNIWADPIYKQKMSEVAKGRTWTVIDGVRVFSKKGD